MNKLALTFSIVCFVLGIACLVIAIIGICLNEKVTAIITLFLSGTACLINGTNFMLYVRKRR